MLPEFQNRMVVLRVSSGFGAVVKLDTVAEIESADECCSQVRCCGADEECGGFQVPGEIECGGTY